MNWEIYNFTLVYMFILCILGRCIGTILEFTISRFLGNMSGKIQRMIFFIFSVVISFFAIQMPYGGTTLGLYMANALGTIGLVAIIFALLLAMKYLARFDLLFFDYAAGTKLITIIKIIIVFGIIMTISFSLGGTVDFVNPLAWAYVITAFFVAKFYEYLL